MKPVESIIKPKRPKGKGWIKGPPVPAYATMGYPADSWELRSAHLLIISAVEVAEAEPGAEHLGPEYHLSISKKGPNGTTNRCTSQEAKFVLRQFGLEDAEEDNHVPNGRVRNFWRPVADKFSGYQCPCKGREPEMVEDKGDFIWRGITNG